MRKKTGFCVLVVVLEVVVVKETNYTAANGFICSMEKVSSVIIFFTLEEQCCQPRRKKMVIEKLWITILSVQLAFFPTFPADEEEQVFIFLS